MSAPAFASILFSGDVPLEQVDAAEEPDCFGDLNLDQLVEVICAKHERAHLRPYFWTMLSTAEEVAYRQDTIRAVEQHRQVRASLVRFVAEAARVRQHLSLMGAVHYALQRQRCLLDAARIYRDAVKALASDLKHLELPALAMKELVDYVDRYAASAVFKRLDADVQRTQDAMDSVEYLLTIYGSHIRVGRDNHLPDLGAAVADLFARFRDRGSPSDPVTYRGTAGFGHIDALVLEKVADLFPDEFRLLVTFAEQHVHFSDLTVLRFAREAEFVLTVLEFKDRLAARGLPMCYPSLHEANVMFTEDCYDAALAARMLSAEKSKKLVLNSMQLDGTEQIIVVTGPNQGGKTTLARTFGQLHYLAALGLPVPGTRARLMLADRVFAQFERQEDPAQGRGKLQDDLIRMRQILSEATARSVVVLNEVFSSTSTDDALALARRMVDQLLERGCLGLIVTFLDELASHDERIVSMVADIDPDDPTVRTFHLTRRPADGRAYAEAIAHKYRLTTGDIKERMQR
jgi:DNA mismatch repair protein MutS